MSSGAASDVSTTRRHGPGAWIVERQRLPPRVGDDVQVADLPRHRPRRAGRVEPARRSRGSGPRRPTSPAATGSGGGGAAPAARRRTARGRRTTPPAPSRPTRSRCPGCRRCCCPAGCARARRPCRPSASRATSPAGTTRCAAAGGAGRARRPGPRPRPPTRSSTSGCRRRRPSPPSRWPRCACRRRRRGRAA